MTKLFTGITGRAGSGHIAHQRSCPIVYLEGSGKGDSMNIDPTGGDDLGSDPRAKGVKEDEAPGVTPGDPPRWVPRGPTGWGSESPTLRNMRKIKKMRNM